MKTKIQTHSGKLIDLIHPDPYSICVNDIAYALAHLCRFGGHCKTFYSVANHSVLVALNVPKEDALVGLMHDAAEAYCQDIVHPLKAILPGYRDVERGLWEAIAWRYGLPGVLPQSVVDADRVLLATEHRDLHDDPIEWDCLRGYTPLPHRIHPMSVTASRSAFLKHYHFLKGKHAEK